MRSASATKVVRQGHSRGAAPLKPSGNSARLVGGENTAIGALVKIPSVLWALRVNLPKCQHPYPSLSRFSPLRVARSGAPQPEYGARPLSHRRGWMASPKKSPVLNAPTSRKNEQMAHPQIAAFWPKGRLAAPPMPC
jgi:hypothetical protein